MGGVIRLFIGLLMLAWANIAQAQDMRFQVELNFEDTGVAPSIPEQVQQALPQLWQRIVPQSAQKNVRGLAGMSLLKSIHPHALSSTVIFNEQRVWQALKARSIPYISTFPRFLMTFDVLDTLGRHNTAMEHELQVYMDELCQTWGIQKDAHAPLLAWHIQWLNDVQFYVSAVQQGHDTQRDQNQWQQGVAAMEQLKGSLQKMLLTIRQSYVAQAAAVTSHVLDAPAVETQAFELDVETHAPLANQIVLETALKSDQRVLSLVPIFIDETHQRYRVVVKRAPEFWLEAWFAKRGMTASMGLDAWLVQ